MNRRNLIGIWKANGPQWVWTGFPVWIGAIFAGLGRAPTLSEWGLIGLFLVTVAALIATCSQFSNIYADRYEDRIYVPSSPLVTGELDVGIAKKALILQNILCGLLLIALLVVTLKYNWYDSQYFLIIALAFGWALGLTYNLPPFRLKETAINPFHFGLGMALAVIVAWLAVAPLNVFIIAFAAFFFLHFVAFGTTNQLRKTFVALNCGQIQVEEGSSVYKISTVIKLKVKTAVALEAIAGLGTFILIPIYWYLGIFKMPLSVALLTLPLAFMILAVVFRIKDPVRNARKCEQFMAMTSLFIVFSFLGVALAGIGVHWGFAILAFILFTAVYYLLERTVRPFGASFRAIQV